MTPRKSRKAKIIIDEEVSFDSEQDTQESDKVDFDALKVAHAIVARNRERREKKRIAVETERGQRVKAVQIKIDSLFDSEKGRVTKSHNDLWKRLNELNRRRQDVEGRILASIRIIERETGNASSALVAMFDGRIEEIEQLATLKK